MNKKWKAFVNEGINVKVRGYVRPADQFHTLGVWEKNIKPLKDG